MFLAIDVGNTEIEYGVLDDDGICFSSRLASDRRRTADEYAVLFRDLLHIHHITEEEISGGIIASVVPPMKKIMQDAVYSFTGRRCLIVGPGVKNGLRIRLDNPAELGADQVCAAVAAIAEYRLPAIIFDMNTATTVSVISGSGDYMGGMIIPGVALGLDALCRSSSLLPQISMDRLPDKLIGANTEECMKSGVIFGTACMIDGLIDRITEKTGGDPTVILTGHVAPSVAKACRRKTVTDDQLILKGLRIIYKKNQKTQH